MLLVCLDCTTKFAVGLEACPHCWSTNYEEDDGMPKSHADGRATVETEDAYITERRASAVVEQLSEVEETPKVEPDGAELDADADEKTDEDDAQGDVEKPSEPKKDEPAKPSAPRGAKAAQADRKED